MYPTHTNNKIHKTVQISYDEKRRKKKIQFRVKTKIFNCVLNEMNIVCKILIQATKCSKLLSIQLHIYGM